MIDKRLRFSTAALAAVVLGCVIVGALIGSPLLAVIMNEYPGLGPGASYKASLHVDSTTMLNTAHPELQVTGPLRIWPQLILWYWTATGRMTQAADGTYDLLLGQHAGVLTTDGQDWLEDQISDSPSATPAAYISLSSSAHAPASSDHKLWNEIDTGGGLDRTGGTYASTGVGAWTVIHQFTADGAYVNVQCTGLCWSDTDDSNSTTLCEDTFASTTLAANDKISITWTLGVS